MERNKKKTSSTLRAVILVIVSVIIFVLALLTTISSLRSRIERAAVYDTLEEAMQHGWNARTNHDPEILKQLNYGNKVVVFSHNEIYSNRVYVDVIEQTESGKYHIEYDMDLTGMNYKDLVSDIDKPLEPFIIFSRNLKFDGKQLLWGVNYNEKTKILTIGGQSPDEVIEIQDASNDTMYFWYYYEVKNPDGEIEPAFMGEIVIHA